MGQSNSEPALAYDDARRRLGASEVSAVEEGFNRLAIKGRLSRKDFRTGFLNSVAGAPVPEVVASALFDSFDYDASGYVTMQEFVCGLAVLRYGKPEEKLRLLFAAYDADKDHMLSDRDLKKFVHALHDGSCATRERAVEDALAKLKQAGPQVEFQRFAQWAKSHIDSPLVEWIFAMERRLKCLQQGGGGGFGAPPAAKALRSSGGGYPERVTPIADDAVSRMTPVQRTECAVKRDENRELQALCAESGLDPDIAWELRLAWRQAAAQSQFEVVDAVAFKSLLPSVPEAFMGRLFNGMDRSRSRTVGLRDWLLNMGVCLHGPVSARQELVFRMFAAADQEVIPATAVHELVAFAERAMTLFVDSPVDEANADSPISAQTCHGDISRRELALEPWSSRVATMLLGIGQVAKVDFKLRPTSPREEREIVERMSVKFDPERPGRPGATWYLVSAKWWEQWCEFSGSGSDSKQRPAPAPIDNVGLVDEHGRLRLSLCHRVDYEVITEGAWKALYAWHGGPGPELSRKTVELDGRCELEMYPLRLRIHRTDEEGRMVLKAQTLVFSRTTVLHEVRKMACGVHGITEPVVVYERRDKYSDWLEADENSNLSEMDFLDEHQVLLKLSSASSDVTPSASVPSRTSVVGLQNMGNTCYMGASLQCLINTPMLSQYFENKYLYDLNTEGSWGMVGKLAVAFSELVIEIHKSERGGPHQVAPRAFKRIIGDFAPTFAGWNQHDAQEFLSIFLSGLSEDVNRTKEDKPYKELKDSAGRPDAEVAAEFWSLHCARECSVIAALFSGQFKSALRCTECGHENASFDPFSFLPVPLPEHDFRWVTCTVASCGTRERHASLERHTIRLCVRVPKRGRLADLLHAAAGMIGLVAEELIPTEMADGYVFKLFSDNDLLSTLGENAQPTIFHAPFPDAEELNGCMTSRQAAPLIGASRGLHSCATEANDDAGLNMTIDDPCPKEAHDKVADGVSKIIVVYLVHRRVRIAERYFLNPFRFELFGTPLVLRWHNICTAAELYAVAWQQVRHLVPDFELSSEVPWPFTLSFVKRDGSACSRCSWREACVGCVLQSSPSTGGDLEERIELSPEATLGINWDAEVLQTHYRAKIAAHVHIHESVLLAQIERDNPESLLHCIDGLVKEEHLMAYCKDCTKAAEGSYTETTHRKTLRLWGFPPLLVLQLKRFHYGATGYKLHNLVSFPMNLDLSEHLAMEEPTTTAEAAEYSIPMDVEPAEEATPGLTRDVEMESAGPSAAEPELDEGFPSLSRDVAQYQLYAVVNHIGGIGSGHYTAYVRRGDSWMCCNDAQVYWIPEDDVVSPNAYLLFYTRADVAEEEPPLEKLFPPHPPGAKPADPAEVKRMPWKRPAGHASDIRREPSSRGDSIGTGCSVM